MSFRWAPFKQVLLASCALSLCGFGSTPSAEHYRVSQSDPAYWAAAIARMERADGGRRAHTGGVLFVGSSSVRMWSSLREDMQPLSVLNRGFGGSEIAHVAHYADRIVLPHKPRGIVFYAGENDLARDPRRDPRSLLRDFERLLAQLQRAELAAPVYFVSIKPSPARARHWPRMHKANALFERFAEQNPRVRFIDVATPMLDESGAPRPELFRADGLHLNAKGYALWSSIVRPVLLRELGADAS